MARQEKKPRGAKPSARAPLSREQVLRAALDLADAGGLETLSMRELGRRLGVEAMSLYNHVANKDAVLDGIVDMVVGEIDLPGPETPWRDFMRQRALSALKVFQKHPWAAALIDTRIGGGMGRLRYFDAILGVLRRAGFPLELAARAFSLLDRYIYGFCRQSLVMAATDAGSPESAEAFNAALPEDAFPYLAEMSAFSARQPGYDEASDFDFGLSLILDGLERHLATGRKPKRPTAG
jgi:AcrR family transcriptional regulator